MTKDLPAPPDWQMLLEKLVLAWDKANGPKREDFGLAVRPLIDSARALLSQPEPEVVEPTDEELLATLDKATADFPPRHPEAEALNAVEYPLALELRKARAAIAADRARYGRPAPPQPEPEVVEPSDVLDWIRGVEPWATWLAPGGSLESAHFEIARLVAEAVARWGRPAPAPAGEVAELVAWLREGGEDAAANGWDHQAQQFARVADLLERLASPACLVLDPSPETIAALKAAGPGRIELLPEDAQIIEPTERTILVPVPVPVAVSERPWEREGWCDSEGRCWWFNPEDPHWVFDDATTCRHWADFSLPHNALPLPAGEVQP